MPLSDCEIGLLIGYNCSKGIEPIDIVPSVGKGPYAQRTRLGWSIIGIIDHLSSQDEIGLSHRIVTYEVPMDKVVHLSLTQDTRSLSSRYTRYIGI